MEGCESVGGGGELRVALHKSTSYLTHCYYAAVYSEVISHFKVWFQRSREKRSRISLTQCYNQLFRSRQSFLSGNELITVKQQNVENKLRNTGCPLSPGRVMKCNKIKPIKSLQPLSDIPPNTTMNRF